MTTIDAPSGNIYAMTEGELDEMAKRFIKAKEGHERAKLAAIDAKAMLAITAKSRSAWASELSEDAMYQNAGPGLHVTNVRIAARVEAEFRRDEEKYQKLEKEAEEKKGDLVSAWEALVAASL